MVNRFKIRHKVISAPWDTLIIMMSNNDGEDDEAIYHKIITRWSLQKENTKQAALWDTPPMWSQRILQLCRWPSAGIPKKVPCTPKYLLWCIFQQFYCFHIIIEQNVSLFLSLVINWFSCEFPFRFKRVITLAAFECSLPCVCPHVLLPVTSISKGLIALVTFERLFSYIYHHHVTFQIINCDAGILASVWLFTRVLLLMPQSSGCLILLF